ncbi:MAG: hypothetical protein M0P74_10555 [Syntrophales bacterium]|jgi:hypothetical protein|nr:hypothetical protein [Syntrophales bacterium]
METRSDKGEPHEFHPEGYYGLWLSVTVAAVHAIRRNRKGKELAMAFIQDPNNAFFEMVAEKLNLNPERLRNKILMR